MADRLRTLLLLCGLTFVGILAYFAFLANPDPTVYLERARQLMRDAPEGQTSEARSLYTEARTYLDKAISIAARLDQDEVLRAALIERSLVHRRLGSTKAAIRDLEEIYARGGSGDLAGIGDLVRARIQTGRRTRKLSEFEGAFEVLAELEENIGKNSPARQRSLHSLRGLACIERADLRLNLIGADLAKVAPGGSFAALIRVVVRLAQAIPDSVLARELRTQLENRLAFLEESRRGEILATIDSCQRDYRQAVVDLGTAMALRPTPDLLALMVRAWNRCEEYMQVRHHAPLFLAPACRSALRFEEDHPHYRQVLFDFAEALRATGQPGRALERLDDHIRRFPDIDRNRLFLSYLELLDAEGLTERLREIVVGFEADPTGVDSRPWLRNSWPYFLGVARASEGSSSSAQGHLDEFLKLSRRRTLEISRGEMALSLRERALRLKAQLLAEEGEYDQADQTLQQLLDLTENRAPVLVSIARIRFEELGDSATAAGLLIQALEEQPALTLEIGPLLRRIGAAVLQNAGVDIDDAGSQATGVAGLPRYLRDPAAGLVVAHHLVERAEYPSASTLLSKIISRFPLFTPAMRLRAQTLSQGENTPLAVRAYRRYLELVPMDGDAWVELAALLDDSSNRAPLPDARAIRFQSIRATLDGAGAIELARRMIAAQNVELAFKVADPTRLEERYREPAAILLSRALAATFPERALQILDQLDPDPATQPGALLFAVRIAARLASSRPAGPLRIADRIQQLAEIRTPPTAELRETTWALLRHGFWEEAQTILEFVPSSSPSRDSTWYRQLGLALEGQGLWSRSQTAFDRALAMADEQGFAAGLDLVLRLIERRRTSDAASTMRLLSALDIDTCEPFRVAVILTRALLGKPRAALEQLEGISALAFPYADAVAILREELNDTPPAALPEGEPLPWHTALNSEERMLFLETLVLRALGGREARVHRNLEHLVDKSPDSPTLKVLWSEWALAAGDPRAGAQSAHEALQQEPSLDAAVVLMDRAFVMLGDQRMQDAIRVQRLTSLCSAKRPDDELIIESSWQLLRRGMALELFSTHAKLGEPLASDPRIRCIQAHAGFQLGQAEETLKHLRALWKRVSWATEDAPTTAAIGREYLRVLRYCDTPQWSELSLVSPRLAKNFPDEPLIQLLHAEGLARELPRSDPHRKEIIARCMERLRATDKSLLDIGMDQALKIIESLREFDEELLEQVLWLEMVHNPERLVLWLMRADLLRKLGREADADHEYRLLHRFGAHPGAAYGLARHLIENRFDGETAERLIAQMEKSIELLPKNLRPFLIASRIELMDVADHQAQALDYARAQKEYFESSEELRDVVVRTLIGSGEPQALEEALELAFDPGGEVAIPSHLLAAVLRFIVGPKNS